MPKIPPLTDKTLTSVVIAKGEESLDITAPNLSVEISIREDSKVLWVNVDGRCVLRICRIPHLILDDRRPTKKKR